jgi:hypothetical protein
MTLPVNEFLRRFLLDVLPPGFVRIRHFGLMAHRHRGVSLPLCLQLLAHRAGFRPKPALKKKPAHLHGRSGRARNAALRWS